MSKLTLQFEGRLLKEYSVGVGLTIGRAPDNAVIIDNPAVSGHHARVFSESGAVILEDLNSTNGTFVNGQHTTRRVLRAGDVLQVGKHQLVFEHTQEWAAAPPSRRAHCPLSAAARFQYRVRTPQGSATCTTAPRPPPIPSRR